MSQYKSILVDLNYGIMISRHGHVMGPLISDVYNATVMLVFLLSDLKATPRVPPVKPFTWKETGSG